MRNEGLREKAARRKSKNLLAQDAINEWIDVLVSNLDGDLVAVIRIDNGARLAAMRSDLLSQAAGFGRIGSIVLCAIQDERRGPPNCVDSP